MNLIIFHSLSLSLYSRSDRVCLRALNNKLPGNLRPQPVCFSSAIYSGVIRILYNTFSVLARGVIPEKNIKSEGEEEEEENADLMTTD